GDLHRAGGVVLAEHEVHIARVVGEAEARPLARDYPLPADEPTSSVRDTSLRDDPRDRVGRLASVDDRGADEAREPGGAEGGLRRERALRRLVGDRAGHWTWQVFLGQERADDALRLGVVPLAQVCVAHVALPV